MNDRELRRYDMFKRVLAFGQDHAADFPPGSQARRHWETLGVIVRELEQGRVTQRSPRDTAREVLFDALRIDLQNIARTARAIAQDEPGFADKYRLPDTPTQHGLLTAADAFLTELVKPGVAEKFIAHEAPPDLISQLQGDLAAIAQAKAQQASTSNTTVGATAAIDERIRTGIKTVTYLDAIVHNKYTRNADKLRAWKSASHTERAPQREKAPNPASSNGTAATGTTATPPLAKTSA